MPKGRTRFRRFRWVMLVLSPLVLGAALTSPWWEVSVRGPTWAVHVGYTRVHAWWNLAPRWSGTRCWADLNDRQSRVFWRIDWEPTGSWPNVRLPAWILVGSVWGVCGVAWWLGPPIPRRGRCRGCGYDLAGLTPDEDDRVCCPECGERAKLRSDR